jgi:2,3-dihydroxybenzoate decarboxylase
MALIVSKTVAKIKLYRVNYAVLPRAMTQLGFKGALINGATNGVYLDDRRYDVFWERVKALGAPFTCIRPIRSTIRRCMPTIRKCGGPWSWAAERAATRCG